MTSLGEKIISIGEKVIFLEQKKNKTGRLIKVQCSHCGRWFAASQENLRVMNYCSECL